jgi:nicotinate-nucleotide adenylyltransferase
MSIYAVKAFIVNIEKLGVILNSYLKENLSPARYNHSISTARMCMSLCERFKYDSRKGFLAGLCHDIAREIPKKLLIASAVRMGCRFEEIEKERPVLLHGKVGAEILNEKFDLKDEEIIHAIRHHTLGRPDFDLLGKSLYVADYCEPGRRHIETGFRENLEKLSLDHMVLAVLEHERVRRKTLAPITQAMYDKIKGNVA